MERPRRRRAAPKPPTPPPSTRPPEEQLARFLAKFTPEIETLALAVLAKMRARLPGAVELVYDNYNALAIGFGPSERTSEAVFSIALFPRWISLFFLLDGARLPDPHGLLKGQGAKVRHIVLADASTLDKPAVRTLMAKALEWAPRAIDESRPNRLIIKSISARQRPRRPSRGARDR
jgi:hypothetical protein